MIIRIAKQASKKYRKRIQQYGLVKTRLSVGRVDLRRIDQVLVLRLLGPVARYYRVQVHFR